jgi:hypothetical protein
MASQDKHCSSWLASIRSPQLPVGHPKYGVGSFHSRMLFLDTIPTLKTAARQVGALTLGYGGGAGPKENPRSP